MDLKDLTFQILLDSCSSVLLMDIQKEKICVLKLEGKLSDQTDFSFGVKPFLNSFLKMGYVYEEDVWVFELLMNPSAFSAQLLDEKKGASLTYRCLKNGGFTWNLLNFRRMQAEYEGSTYVLIYCYELNQEESNYLGASTTIFKQLHKVVKADLTNNHYITIKEYEADSVLRQKYNTDFISDELLIKGGMIHPEDVSSFKWHMDTERIKEYFRAGKGIYEFTYRRRVGILYQWVKMTVQPALEYSSNREVFIYVIWDVQKEMLKILDMMATMEYEEFFMKQENRREEGYYENLLSVVHNMTQSYVDFYMIDLDKDLYIQYKIRGNLTGENNAHVGKYSEILKEYIKKVPNEADKDKILPYSTTEKLKELMADRMTMEYTFLSRKGVKMKTTYRKVDAIHGVPSRLLCHTEVCRNDRSLIVKTFGNFEVFLQEGVRFQFARGQSAELFAFLIDQQGFPVSSKDIVCEMMEREAEDKNAIKYVSTMIRRMTEDLEKAGYGHVIVKEKRTIRVNTDFIDCDYYRLMNGDTTYWKQYHNEYMKEFSWAEETNSELQMLANR